MEIIKQSYEIIDRLDADAILKKLELCGRVCYKSEGKIKDGSAKKLLSNIIKRGHESVLEHFTFSVRFITDRGVTHELVRHRVASFSQESQRYVNYKGGMEFILPVDFYDKDETDTSYSAWVEAMDLAEHTYREMVEAGCAPQLARSVLPNSAKTEIVVTANIREWRHILRLRTSQGAHPQIRALMASLLMDLNGLMPVLFSDIACENA